MRKAFRSPFLLTKHLQNDLVFQYLKYSENTQIFWLFNTYGRGLFFMVCKR